MPLNSVTRSHLLMMVATIFVATSFPVSYAIADELDSLVLAQLRFALAAILFAPVIAIKYGFSVPGWRDLCRYGAISGCHVAFFWGTFAALRHTSALNAAAIFTLAPVVTTIAAILLLRERPGLSTMLALPIGAAGAALVVFRGDLDALTGLQLGTGELIFLGGTAALGLYSPLIKRLHKGEPMPVVTFWTLVTGSVWLFVFSFPTLAGINWRDLPVPLYAGTVYLALFATLATFLVFQWSVAIIGPTRVMAYTFLSPALVMAIGLFLGDELPPVAIYPGLLLSILATFVLQAPTFALNTQKPRR